MEGTGVEWRGGKGRAGQDRVPDCLGGLSRVGISSRSTRPWNGQPPGLNIIELAMCVCNTCVDSQLLNGWKYGHENGRVCSRTRSHDSVIFFVFFGLIFFKLRRIYDA